MKLALHCFQVWCKFVPKSWYYIILPKYNTKFRGFVEMYCNSRAAHDLFVSFSAFFSISVSVEVYFDEILDSGYISNFTSYPTAAR